MALMRASREETSNAPSGLRTSSISSPSLRPSSKASEAGRRTARLFPHLATFIRRAPVCGTPGYPWIYIERRLYERRAYKRLNPCGLLDLPRRRFRYIGGRGVGYLPLFPCITPTTERHLSLGS